MTPSRHALLTFLTATLTVAVIGGQSPPFRYERPIVADRAGPHRLAVDAALVVGAARLGQNRPQVNDQRVRWSPKDGFADLRLFDASNQEVPYLMVWPDDVAEQWVRATVLPVTATQKTSGFEADLQAADVVDAIQLKDVPAPFLKRVVLEGSGDRERWTLLVGQGTLFDLPAEQLRQTTLTFQPGPYRFLRITWDDTNSGRVPMPSAVFVRRARMDRVEPPPVLVPATFERRPSEPGRSRYRIRFPAAGLPVWALRLEVGGGHVFRNVIVTESRILGGQAAPKEVGRATLSRVVRDGMTAEALRIPLAEANEPNVDLVVEDGNNPPLELNRVTLEMLRFPWIYFEATGSPIVARYGDPALTAPRYDLEAARDSVRPSMIPEARWGEPRDLAPSAAPSPPPPSMPDTGAPLDASGFRFRRPLPDVPAGLVALPLDASVLALSHGAGRLFEDVRIVNDTGQQIPYLLERQEEPLSLDLALQPFKGKAPELTGAESGSHSTYSVDLPYANLPNATLVLETSGRVFTRSVRAGAEHPADRNHRDAWFEPVATKSWTHAEQDTPAPALSLPLGTVRDQRVVVVIDEGDNRPLPITKARLLLPSYRLRFFHPGKGLSVVYGREDVSLPRYDLALLSAHVMGAEAKEIAAATPPENETPGPVTSLLPPKYFWAGLVVAVVVILGVIVRSMRT